MRRWVLVVMLGGCGRIGFGDLAPADTAPADTAPADTAPAATATSCATVAQTCGSTGVSCCDRPLVTGGTFDRGYDAAGDGLYTDMTHPATVSSFRLDRFEVTVGRFRQFMAAGGPTQAHPPEAGAGAHSNIPNSGWDATWNSDLAADLPALESDFASTSTWTDAPGANENEPMVGITWWEAMAFCAWDGGYLPTEAQWRYAASGGQQRAFPWSSPPSALADDCDHANTGSAFGSGADPMCSGGLIDVGMLPAGDGAWGHSDLGGNAYEWVLDWFDAYADPCDDCANLTASSVRVDLGGSYYLTAGFARVESRGGGGAMSGDVPGARWGDLGFRCASDP